MFRIKELREAKGINMKEAARLLAMPYTTYVNYEKGQREPTSEVLIQIADFFDVSIDYLVGRTEDRSKKTIPDSDIQLGPDAQLARFVGQSISAGASNDHLLFLKALFGASPEELHALSRFARRLAAEYENADSP